MKKSIYFGLILLTILSCKTTSTATNTVNTEENSTIPSFNSNKKPYFKASGTEPFWSIQLYEDKIVYKTPEDSIFLPHTEPILAMDSNVKLYNTKTKSSEFKIQISQQECANEMSGEIFPYKITVDFKKNASSNFEKINGCGQYIIDYRLHDIWVLEELNGNKINKEDFTNTLPVIEIFKNLNSYRFSGILGCNRIMSSLFFEREKLRFNSITSTKMMCGNSNKEAELITALESVTTYSIEENRLILSNPSGRKIILKKID